MDAVLVACPYMQAAALACPVLQYPFISFPYFLQVRFGLWTMIKKYAGLPDTKVLVLLCYYFLLAEMSTIVITVGANGRHEFESQLTSYFVCESTGVMSGETCERTFNRLDVDLLTLATLVLMGFYSTVNLIYVVNVQELKKKWLRFRGRNSTRINWKIQHPQHATSATISADV